MSEVGMTEAQEFESLAGDIFGLPFDDRPWEEKWWDFTFGEDRVPDPIAKITNEITVAEKGCGAKCPYGSGACIEEGYCIVEYEHWSERPHVWQGDNA